MSQAELIEVGPASVEQYDNEGEWLEARRNGIGASEAPAVLGISPWKSPMGLYCEKLGLAEPDAVESERMLWGHLLEPILVQRYQHVTGRAVSRPAPFTILRSRAHPFMCFSPDGFVFDPARGPGPLQIKTAAGFRADEWEGEPPLAYLVQVQHEIAVSGARWGALAVLLGGQRFLHFEIERNDAFLEAMVAREAEFWRRLTEQDPPAIDGSDASRELLRRLYPREHPGLVVNLPSDAIEWDRERLDAIDEGKRADARKLEAENKLKAALGEAECGVLTNGVSFTWKSSERKGYTVEPAVVRTLRRKATQ